MKRLILFSAILFIAISCSSKEEKKITSEKPRKDVSPSISLNKPSEENLDKGLVKYIESDKHFEEVMGRSDSVLLVFDLYADWCKPCKILSPILEEISVEAKGKAEIYKINVDKHPNISKAFGVRSIPLVVFIKNQEGVNGLVGVQPKKAYLDAINKFTF